MIARINMLVISSFRQTLFHLVDKIFIHSSGDGSLCFHLGAINNWAMNISLQDMVEANVFISLPQDFRLPISPPSEALSDYSSPH